jgi:hypothetical protein
MRGGAASTAAVGALIVTSSLLARPALAQDADKATAQALFDTARRDMDAGRFAAACPEFASSYKLDPGPGTLLNLAVCYEKNGQTASAWATFLDAATEAGRAGETPRVQMAREHAQALEPVLARLTVVVAAEARVDGLTVRRDGTAVPPEAWGRGMPVDPGHHVIEATAPGKRPWSAAIDVAAAQQASVQIVLADVAAAGPLAPGAPSSPRPPVEARAAGSSTQRTLAYVAGGVGVAGLAVGTVFGLVAMSGWTSAKTACGGGCADGSSARTQGEQATSFGNVSTGGFVAGGVALAAGITLYLTSPRVQVTPTLAPSAAGLAVRTTW